MLSRRETLSALIGLPAAAGLAAAAPATEITRPLRGGGAVPVIGIGTARAYAQAAGEEQLAPLRATLARFVARGGRMVDTAPSYGEAEDVLGRIIAELKLRDRLFLATKVGAETREEGKAQIEASFRRLRTTQIDLIAVHNLRDVDDQLALLRALQREGRIGAVGATTSFDAQYPAFEALIARAPLDVIQVDYALDNRNADQRILPMARDKGIAVMVNLPFGRDRLFAATRGRPLPGWASEIGAASWAQIFLKYVVSHPSRPIAIPGMSQARHVDDDLAAARGPLPDAALRRRMEQYIDAL